MNKRRPWTDRQLHILHELYPDNPAAYVAEVLGRTVSQVYNRAAKEGLKKSEEFLSGSESGRLRGERGKSFRFQKGHVPANKGLRRPGWGPGRMKETQFKKGDMSGAAQHNYKPIGSTRITDGQLQKKITDDQSIYPSRRWVAVQRLVWEAEQGPIAKGHAVVFKPGAHTTVEEEITIDKLECLSRAQLMKRNSYHTRYPKEIGLAIQARGALTRQINKRLNCENQD